MPPKVAGPLTEEEYNARMRTLEEVIWNDAKKEIKQISAESTEDIDEMKRSLVSDPRQIIDEWVEKLRAFTERHTKIHCARLRRIAKLRILEAYGDIRESIKNEARERIKEKMSKKGDESDGILREMLFQGLLRLMESKVLVHTTKADLGRVSKHYDWATKKYKNMTGMDLVLMTSRHPLKDHYYGRVVISDKHSTMFVDINLFTSVDKVADEVFSHYAAYQDKATTSKNWGMEALKQRGLHIMPRGPNITAAQLDSILSTMRGDPRTQAPVFQIKEEEKKQVVADVETHQGAEWRPHGPKTRKVTIAPNDQMPNTMRPSLSMMEPGTYAPAKYNYRQSADTSNHTVGPTNDLYNLEYTSNQDLITQAPSRATVPSPPNGPYLQTSTISADKEAPKAPTKEQQHVAGVTMAESRESTSTNMSSNRSSTTQGTRESQ